MTASYKPEGYQTCVPYLIVDDAHAAIDFYSRAFGFKELLRMERNGRMMHAEMRLGDSTIMLAQACEAWGAKDPKQFGGSPVNLMIYVEDCDAVYQQALQAGATERRPVADQFYGDRSGCLYDPFGHGWTVATHKEDVPIDECNRRFDEMMKQQAEPTSA